jgi:hypothetical protein
MYWVHFDSINFTFDAFGRDEHEAWLKMRAGIRKHGEQYKMDPPAIQSLGVEVFKEGSVMKIKSGFYRDMERVETK